MTPEEVDRWLDVVERALTLVGPAVAFTVIGVSMWVLAVAFFAPLIRDMWRSR